MTGTLAQGHTFYAYVRATGTISKPISNSQQIDITYQNYSSFDTVQIYQPDINTGYSAGDKVIAEAEIEIISATNVEGIWVELVDKGSANKVYKGLSKYDDPEYPNQAGTYLFQTPIAMTQNDSSSLAVSVRQTMNSTNNKTANLNILIKNVRCRIV